LTTEDLQLREHSSSKALSVLHVLEDTPRHEHSISKAFSVLHVLGDTPRPFLFRTYEAPEIGRKSFRHPYDGIDDLLLWEASLASIAGGDIPSMKYNGKGRTFELVNGSAVASNPVEIAVHEIRGLKQDIQSLISLGFKREKKSDWESKPFNPGFSISDVDATHYRLLNWIDLELPNIDYHRFTPSVDFDTSTWDDKTEERIFTAVKDYMTSKSIEDELSNIKKMFEK